MRRGERNPHLTSWFWLAVSAGAAYLLWRSNRSPRSTRPPEAADQEATIKSRRTTIRRRPAEVYGIWRDLAELPRFVPYLRSARESADGSVVFTAALPGDRTVEWTADIVEERAGELLRWESPEASPVMQRGCATFAPAPADRGTEMTLEIEYGGGAAGNVLAKLSAAALKETLRRFKQFVETGEIATIDGQASARREERVRPELRAAARRCLERQRDRDRTSRIDHALEETFPASDPPAFGGEGLR